jgi:hypothetical protein
MIEQVGVPLRIAPSGEKPELWHGDDPFERLRKYKDRLGDLIIKAG